MKVGIVGNGFVGSAISYGFSEYVPVYIYDKDPRKSVNSFEETVNESDFVFVSVPTPMNENGSINLANIYDVFSNIDKINKRKDNIILLKSTVTPGTTDTLAKEFPNLRIVFNPEFLTERKAKFDFINQSRLILGGPREYTEKVEKLYNYRFSNCNTVHTDWKTAEFIKYFGNIFFAVKVSFANEMKRVCESIEADWDAALTGFVADSRIADSHLRVPGPDGKRGFGGSCLPKDINAFMNYCDVLGVDINIIKAAWKTNLEVRPEKDWEKLKGRAVSE
tara:strand:- start:747 stop:1580 length:834 start_codon:yes stop_codon:yes gene_type:complete